MHAKISFWRLYVCNALSETHSCKSQRLWIPSFHLCMRLTSFSELCVHIIEQQTRYFLVLKNCRKSRWRIRSQLIITLKNNTIRCKKLATINSSRKNVGKLFIRQKQARTISEIYQQHFGTRDYLFSPEKWSYYVF